MIYYQSDLIVNVCAHILTPMNYLELFYANRGILGKDRYIMNGRIDRIVDYGGTKPVHGFIVGDDNISYYFNGKLLSDGYEMSDLKSGELVTFTPGQILFDGAKPQANNVKPQNITSRFYKPGFSKNLDLAKAEKLLKRNSGEMDVLRKLSELLYFSYIGSHDMGHHSTFPFCLVGNTSILKQYIRGQYEFLLVFSHFDSCDWQQNTIKAAQAIRLRKEISERRPLVNFYILISNARNLTEEIDKMKGGTSAAIIPFSFSEILAADKATLQTLLLNRFDEYYFENNMLGEEKAIEEDTLLFGDRGKIADSIVQRCIDGNHSGVFGLRRSGKSSVLRAVERRLDYNQIKYVSIESRSFLETIDSWKTALFDIAKEIRKVCLGLQQEDGETRADFLKRLSLSSTEEDYQKRAAQCFVEDVKLYTKNQTTFVIALDEIELITYNTATSETWRDLDAYKGFWGALRDSGCSMILCGVNSTINEKSVISFNGKTCDNPMYERIHSCSDFSKTYLPAFTDEQTRDMLNKLGGYSNVAFDNVYTEINRAFGGQPYAIRQFAAYMFEKVKNSRKPHEVYEFSKAAFDRLIVEFSNSDKGIQLFKTILQHIKIYREEYEMLEKIALAPEKYRTVEHKDISLIDHLEKYGLIEYDRSTLFVTFNIHAIQEHIQKTATKSPKDMDNDERRRYIQEKVKICEQKLKKFILTYYTFNGGDPAGKKVILANYGTRNGYVTVNSKAKPAPDTNLCALKDLFDHSLFIMYFSTLKKIISNNWKSLGQAISNCGITKSKFEVCMEDLNAGRTDADHYDAEDMTCPDKWDIDDRTMQNFISAYETMLDVFKKLNL